MHHAGGALLIVFILGLALAAGLWLRWRLEPARRTRRALMRILGAAPDAAAVAPLRHQGVGMRVEDRRLALVRGVGDPGLVYDLHELVGVELIFDGQVAARMFRGEARKPLDQISPAAERVLLRLVFDDMRDPEFELELLRPADLALRVPPDAALAVQEGRRWFARLEAVLRRAGSEAAATR